jgi:hypothetical protein
MFCSSLIQAMNGIQEEEMLMAGIITALASALRKESSKKPCIIQLLHNYNQSAVINHVDHLSAVINHVDYLIIILRLFEKLFHFQCQRPRAGQIFQSSVFFKCLAFIIFFKSIRVQVPHFQLEDAPLF